MLLRDHQTEGQTEMSRRGTQGAGRVVGRTVSRITQRHKLRYLHAIYLDSGKPTHGLIVFIKDENRTYKKNAKSERGHKDDRVLP